MLYLSFIKLTILQIEKKSQYFFNKLFTLIYLYLLFDFPLFDYF